MRPSRPDESPFRIKRSCYRAAAPPAGRRSPQGARRTSLPEQADPVVHPALPKQVARAGHLQPNRSRGPRIRVERAQPSPPACSGRRPTRAVAAETLGSCTWVAERHNLILVGPTGIGKSFLCCAFVERACRRGFTARYVRMPRLLHELAVGRADGSRLLARLAKLDLLAIDDWMLAPLRDTERRDLTEVIEDRAERAPNDQLDS